jgi:hypothetical protein
VSPAAVRKQRRMEQEGRTWEEREPCVVRMTEIKKQKYKGQRRKQETKNNN